jgi:deoxyguanosine kinase
MFKKHPNFATHTRAAPDPPLYDRLVGWLELEVMAPDVVVYLQATPDVLMRRIAKRARSYEKDMDPAYIKQLNEAYNYFFFHYTGAPLLVVNTSAIDFVANPEDFEDLLTRIRSHREGTTYYRPIQHEETP